MVVVSLAAILWLPFGTAENREMYRIGVISLTECNWRIVGSFVGLAMIVGTTIWAIGNYIKED